jgi:hypothetical protein
VYDLEMEEEGQQGQCGCVKNGGKEWEWAVKEERCVCEFWLSGKKDIDVTIG